MAQVFKPECLLSSDSVVGCCPWRLSLSLGLWLKGLFTGSGGYCILLPSLSSNCFPCGDSPLPGDSESLHSHLLGDSEHFALSSSPSTMSSTSDGSDIPQGTDTSQLTTEQQQQQLRNIRRLGKGNGRDGEAKPNVEQHATCSTVEND